MRLFILTPCSTGFLHLQKMKWFVLFVFVMVRPANAFAQHKQHQDRSGAFYFTAGTHKAIYSKSNIHLNGSGTQPFGFTLEGVRAKDDFFLRQTGGAPQYDYKIGYFFKKKNLGIEFNFDHIKYFVRKDQHVRTVGNIDNQHIDAQLPVTTYVQNFEHSDGANYALFNIVKWKSLPCGSRTSWDWIVKAGAGPVVPKTNSTVMNRHWDDRYKIAGYVIALETGIRYNFYKHFFIEPSVKGAYANYTEFLIANGDGHQKWFSGQFILAVGTYFRL